MVGGSDVVWQVSAVAKQLSMSESWARLLRSLLPVAAAQRGWSRTIAGGAPAVQPRGRLLSTARRVASAHLDGANRGHLKELAASATSSRSFHRSRDSNHAAHLEAA
jgi:hypothetical protein